MSYYKFSREDLIKVADNPLFIESIKIVLEETFYIENSELWYHGDIRLFKYLKTLPKSKWFDILQNYSLIYLAPFETPNKYNTEHHKELLEELNIRTKILEKTRDKYDPSWYAYIHCCQYTAVFIIYPIVKLLYPNQKFYLFDGIGHTVITNAPLDQFKDYFQNSNIHQKLSYTRDVNKPCIFDIISQCGDLNLDLLIPNDYCDPKKWIEESNIMTWYLQNYANANSDCERMQKWFNHIYTFYKLN